MDARNDTRPQIGMDVIDSNDHLVGTVEEVNHDHFVVGPGLFLACSQCIPTSAISDIRGNELRLRISRESALQSSVDTHWLERPGHGETADISPTGDVISG